MGTVFSFDVPDERVAAEALPVCVAWLHWVDATFSTYRDDSDISRLGRGEIRLADCPPEVATVLDLCADATARTDGFFTSVPGGRLDPSGLVKGWAVDEVSRQLSIAGSLRHCVNGGGDVRAVGGSQPGVPWQIGVTHPLYAGELAAIVRIHDGAVATSGTAERGHHVVNPLTGEPATALASVTVVGAHLTWVDVVATAALARGADARRWLTALDGVEALAVAADGSGWWTPGFPAYGTVPHSPLPGSHQPGLSELAES